MRHLIAGLLLSTGFLLMPESKADAETWICSCPSPNGNQSASVQSGPGICSVAQIERRCAAVSFQVIPGSAYAEIGPRVRNPAALQFQLNALGIEGDPVAVIEQVAKLSPEKWREDDFVPWVMTLFAISQVTQDRSPALYDIHRSLVVEGDRVRPFFLDPHYRDQIRGEQIGDFRVRVAYGCLEMSKSVAYVLARTPYSAAKGMCSDFQTGAGLLPERRFGDLQKPPQPVPNGQFRPDPPPRRQELPPEIQHLLDRHLR